MPAWRTPKCTHKPNRHFVGRDDELRGIHTSLHEAQGNPRPTSWLVHGLAGIGKTQLVLEYCHRYADDHDWQFWLPSRVKEELLDVVGRLMERLRRLSKRTATDDVVGDFVSWLEATENSWIVVFDGVDDWAVVQDLIPRRCASRSAIFLTSQLVSLASEVNFSTSLGPLSVAEGAELLCRCLYEELPSKQEHDAAMQISRMVAAFPLALAHIGGFIVESAISIERYDKAFNSRVRVGWNGKTHANLNPRHSTGWGGKTHATLQYHGSMEAAWDFPLNELPPVPAQLVQVLSFMHPDHIPESILLEAFSEEPVAWGVQAGSEEVQLWESRRWLRKRSLVSIHKSGAGNEAYTVHPVLQNAILLHLDRNPSLRSAIFSQAFKVIRLATPKANSKQIPTPKLWPQFKVAIPHIVSLCRKFVQSVPLMKGTLELAQLLYDGGFFLWETQDGATDEAVLILSTSLKILDDVSYPVHGRLRADILAIMGMCCDRLGPAVFKQALVMRTEARRIRQAITDREIEEDEEVSPISDRLLYNSLNDQGIAEMQLNHFRQAELLFSECLHKYETWGSEEDFPFEYAKYYHNMGLVRMCQGCFADAVAFLNKAVDLEERYEGAKTSPLISLFAYDFACVLFHAGDVNSALAKHLEILYQREEQHGKYSEITLLSCYTVGAMYHHAGDLEQAERYIKECIDRSNHTEADQWPDYAQGRASMHLAKLMRARCAPESETEPFEETGKGVLAKYIDAIEPIMPKMGDSMTVFDAMQPILHGRFTGRALVPLLQRMSRLNSGFSSRGF